MALEDYTRGEALGQGATGAVWSARGPAGDVAIKLLAVPSAERRQRFERELAMMLRLGREPGFVPVIEGGVAGAQAYLIMPLLAGGTLRQRLRDGRLPPADAVALVERLARTMGVAHRDGVVHRDLKPENVLFDSDGRAWIADMGLARWVEGVSEHSLGLSKSGQMRGTVGYMPPEQLRSARSVTPAADVFALGAILHECLSGEPAFGAETALSVVARIEQGEFEPLDVRGLGLDPGLAAVVARCLDPEADRRYPDGAALAAALRAPPAPPRRRLGALASAAAALALLAAGGAAWLWIARGREPAWVLDDGGDGLPAGLRERWAQAQTLRCEAVWGSEVGALGPHSEVYPLTTGFLITAVDPQRTGYDLTAVAPNGVRAATRRRAPLRALRRVDLEGRVLLATDGELHSVYQGASGWLRPLEGSQADLGDARVFDGVAHWLGHQPGVETARGAFLYWQAEGGPLLRTPFPDGVWRNGELRFLGGPERAVFVAAKGEGADPERQLIAWSLTPDGGEVWRVTGLGSQDQVRPSLDGAHVAVLDEDLRRLRVYSGEDGALRWSQDLDAKAAALTVLEDTHLAYLSGPREVTVRALADGAVGARWSGDSPWSALIGLPGRPHLLTSSFAHARVERRDWRDGRALWAPPRFLGRVIDLCEGEGGEVLVADEEGVLRLNAQGVGERVLSWGHEPTPAAFRLALSPRWAVARSPRDGEWKPWAFPLTGGAPTPLAELEHPRYEALALHGDLLLLGGYEEVLVYDLARDRALMRQAAPGADRARAVAWTEREQEGFVCVLPSGSLLWVTHLGVAIRGNIGEAVRRLAADPGGTLLAAAFSDGSVWAGPPAGLRPWGRQEEPRSLAWLADGRLVGVDRGGLTVWADEREQERIDLTGVNESGRCLARLADGRLLLGTDYASVLVLAPR
ncbi:MAG: protein kinase [Planctomycetota bacterium]